MRCFRYLALVAVLVYLAWFGAPENRPFGGYEGWARRGDYYNLLTEGFLSGHTWMNLPEVPEGTAPEGYNDASFYRGHYYLDFGATPVVFFLLPFKVLTGKEAPLPLCILVCVGVGTLLQGLVLGDARRRYFPALCPWFEALLWILLACGSTCPLLLAVSQIYETAIAAGYLFASLTWYALYRAMHAAPGSRGWLALASLAAGLAVASRPSLLLLFPALAGAAAWLIHREARPSARWGAGVCAVVPAALIGAAMIAYNVARFGKATEMGIHYQHNPLNDAHAVLMSPHFFAANLRWYYLRLPSLTPYFPFVLPMDTFDAPAGYSGSEWVHGQLAFLLAAAGIAAVALLTPGRRGRVAAPLRVFVSVLIASGLLVLGFLCLAGVRADRYEADCQGTLVLAVAIIAGWTAAPLSWKGRALPAFLVLAVSAYNLLTPYAFTDEINQRLARAIPSIERTFNFPSYWAYRAGLLHYGPRRLTVRFPEKAGSLVEPLICAGSPLGRDTLESVRLDAAQEQFIFDSGEHGNVKSRPFLLVRNHAYAVDVDMGAFYPPRNHPFFDGWDPNDVERAKTIARVAIDGTALIHTRIPFADSAPDAIEYGRGPSPASPPFSGTILSNVRLPPRDFAHDPTLVEPGLWKVSLEPLLRPLDLHLPVVAAGKHGQGVLILTVTRPDRSLAFGMDVWGFPIVYSESFEVSPGYHTVMVFEGHQALATHPAIAARLTPVQRARVERQLLVWWDGQLRWHTEVPYFRDAFDLVALGSNPQHFSAEAAIYAGAFFPEAVTEADVEAAVAQATGVSP